MTDLLAPVAVAEPNARPPRRRARSEWPGRVVTLLGLLIGLVILVYPILGTYYNNYKAYEFAKSAGNGVTAGQTPDTTALEAAHRYNASLSPSLLKDPWAGKDALSTPEYKAYSTLLGSPTTAMATLRFPAIKAMLPIYHGTSEWALDRGAGHMYGTALPVGGKGTHAALAAHRGLPNLTGFDRLPEVKVGDQFFVDVAGTTLAYQVSSVATVLPDDVSRLTPRAGQDLVTLITCTPYGINTHRILVTGSRIPWSQADRAQAEWQGFDWTVQSWMWPRLACGAATLLIALWLLGSWIHGDRRRRRLTGPARVTAAPKESS